MKNKKFNPLALDEQLCFALYSASRLVTKAYEPYLKELDLTYPQYLVFLVLWEATDPVSVKEIGERLILDSGTLSPLLKKLETKKLINRVRSKEDERIVMIELTEKGRELKSMAKKIPESLFCEFEMPEKEFLSLRTELRSLVSNLLVQNVEK